MKRSLLALCAGASLLVVADTAAAHTTSTPTEVVLHDVAFSPPGTVAFHGDLTTSNRCARNRRILMSFSWGDSPPNTFELVDEDRTSLNGNWAGSGPERSAGGFFFNGLKVRATRKVLGGPGHRHICEPDTFIG